MPDPTKKVTLMLTPYEAKTLLRFVEYAEDMWERFPHKVAATIRKQCPTQKSEGKE